MSETTTNLPLGVQDTNVSTPGQIIRQAREGLGLHIVALAAALKVPVRKLEALEANRWEELTDTTFTRALASSVARHLKIDAGPVLAGLPSAALAQLNSPAGLGRVDAGGASVGLASAPVMAWGRTTWVVVALLFAAVLLYFSPELKSLLPVFGEPTEEAASTDKSVNLSAPIETAPNVGFSSSSVAVDAASVPVNTGEGSASQAASGGSQVDQPITPNAAVSPSTGAEASDRVLVLSAEVDSWVEVVDSNKQVRIQRVLKPGEEVVFSDAGPFAVVVGNAAGIRVNVRGQFFDLAALTKNNVARFDVK